MCSIGHQRAGSAKREEKEREVEIQDFHTLEIPANYQSDHCGGQARTAARGKKKNNGDLKPSISQSSNGVKNHLSSHHSEWRKSY